MILGWIMFSLIVGFIGIGRNIGFWGSIIALTLGFPSGTYMLGRNNMEHYKGEELVDKKEEIVLLKTGARGFKHEIDSLVGINRSLMREIAKSKEPDTK